jgi:hypothetical protein
MESTRINAGEKWCTKGKHFAPITQFGIDNSRGDKLAAKCKDCLHSKNPWASLKGRISTFLGKSHTAAAKEKQSLAKKGKPSLKRGVARSKGEREKIRLTVLKTQKYGADHPNYKHGNNARNLDARRDPKYRAWRKAVFERDHYTCQKCGDNRGGNLRAHHKKPFANYPELRFEVSNGITYCNTCHELEHFKPDSIRNQRKLKRGERLWR